jgi:hypothetical protein
MKYLYPAPLVILCLKVAGKQQEKDREAEVRCAPQE